jgi:hypothetical protein
MAILLSVAASRCLANAAAVAASMAGGTTTAEAQGIADLLLVCSQKPDLVQPLLLLSNAGKTNLITPG